MEQGTCPVCGQRIAIIEYLPATWAVPELGYLERHESRVGRSGTKCQGSFGYWKERQLDLSEQSNAIGSAPVAPTEFEFDEHQRELFKAIVDDPNETVIANLRLWADTDRARISAIELLVRHGLAEGTQPWIKRDNHPSGWPGYWVDPDELERAAPGLPKGMPVALAVELLRSSERIQRLTNEARRKRDVARQLNDDLGLTLVAALTGVTRDQPNEWARSEWPSLAPEVWVRAQFANDVWNELEAAEGRDVARRWFIGANPLLNQRAPVLAIREDRHAEVRRAVDAFINGDVDD
jgi:hypothetical protein